MIVEADFVNHWKTRALVNQIGDDAYRCLLSLWAHCQTRKAWEFQLNALKLAGICGFTGDSERLWQAMKELHWLDPAEELGWYQVHGWGTVNASLVGSWTGGAKTKGATWHARGYPVLPAKKTPPASKGGTPGATPGSTSPETPAISAGASDRLDRIGLDREEKNEKEEEGGSVAADAAFGWSPEIGWQGLTTPLFSELGQVYPACEIKQQFLAMDQWLQANPDKAERDNWRRFFTNWLKREQAQAPQNTPSRPISRSPNDPQKSQKKEGAAAPAPDAKKIAPADFPWREVARDIKGEELVGTWEQQDPRTRKELRSCWSELAATTKAAMWELTKGGASDGEA